MYRDKIIESIIQRELSSDKTIKAEGFDIDKFHSEGSTWIVYIWDCYTEYYKRHKKRIDEKVNKILTDEMATEE